MPATITRLILSIAMLFGVVGLYMPVFFVLDSRFPDALALWITNLLCGGVLVLAWCAIWRQLVRWTSARRLWTIASIFLAMVPAAAMVLLLSLTMRFSPDEIAAVFSAMIWAPAWLACTALVWRETRLERIGRLRRLGADAIPCPACGYNLTGLREARCPECGSQFTLEQLLASQRRDADLGDG